MFDFTDEKKEKYYARAEEYFAEHNLKCFRIDRERIGYLGREHKVKIYLVPFTAREIKTRELERLKRLKDIVVLNDRTTNCKKGKPRLLRENAYVVLELDEEDR